MKITSRVRYAVLALARLARGPAFRADFAAVAGVTTTAVGYPVARLVRAGFVRSDRRDRGRYSLARAPGEITLLDVVEAIEGTLEPEADPGGRLPTDAALLKAMKRAAGAYREALRAVTLADLAGGKVGRRGKGD